MDEGKHSRRTFLTHSAGLGAVALAACGARGEQETAAGKDRLRCGVIGVGKRGGALLQTLLELDTVRVVAVADTYDVWRNRAVAWCRQKDSAVADYVEFDRMLRREKLDAAFIATPAHILAPAALEALRRRCAVYIERPMALSWEPAKAIRDTARKQEAIVQVGTQRRSTDLYMQAREILASGRLGSLALVQVNHYEGGQALDRDSLPKEATEESVHWPLFVRDTTDYPFDPLRYFHWSHFEEYSGGLNGGLLADHLDACHFLARLGMPMRVLSTGTLTKFADGRTCPDTVNTLAEYAGGLQFSYTASLTNGQFGIEERYICTQGALHIRNMQEMTIYRDDIEENVRSNGPNTRAHVENFIAAVRTGSTPATAVEDGFHVAACCDMAVMSVQAGTSVTWDSANEQVVV